MRVPSLLFVFSTLLYVACGGAGNQAETTVETYTDDVDDADMMEDRDR
jgi:hypothetical protein